MGGTYRVAVVGVTGAVGQQMVACLEERNFPVGRLVPLASERSLGKTVTFLGKEISVGVLNEDSFDGVEIALFSAGGGISKEFGPIAARAGAVVVDNSSAWRMDPEVPLVVPEVNPHDIGLYTKTGIIANPNCSTIQMVVALKPLHDAARIKRVVVSTYQAVSGTGQKAVDELAEQVQALLSCQPTKNKIYPHRIAFNCLPHIDVFLENGYTKEEMKMVNETVKIMGDDSIRVTATTVRVPVFYGHSEAVNIETERKLTPDEARRILAAAPGVKVVDNPAKNEYPMPLDAAGQDLTLVGRIREDFSIPNGLNFWVVADNLRKGAATNAIQIAELLIRDYLRK
ncbi:MAG: aspartate-semialdehyde dehydrogenase [Desulfobacterales bacterium]|nr:aspartate-semialdehyde dehydrogenase [Pseudomonadota bacterium]MCG2772864.1 aspartate-semialdehyde dehydrogenase [Desulfobacterales bacterium]